ncbi:MAG: polysaccharide deacetylase family protein [Verrucomicrobia bacterium]|nr:polysaccharide deacetylase family protein [Verrucomicrobiota bacterium]
MEDESNENFQGNISVCPWPDDKRWAYSITFDEALSDLHRFAVPILEKHGVPGHLEVVVGQMGRVRQIGESSYNGFKHMNTAELRAMLARGWGVGNHSWSHATVNAETADVELKKAKQTLEEATGAPVTIYCAPGNNSNMNDEALAACRQFGYLGAMSLTDALNRPGDGDLLWLNRTFLHDQGYAPFFSEFDPFRNLAHARREHGWVIDYCHCPLEKPIHRNKDCSAAQLRERLETVLAGGSGEVWLARVEDAVDYRYTRRAVKIKAHERDGYDLSAPDLHPAVRRRTLTLTAPRDFKAAEVDGHPCPMRPHGDRMLLDMDLSSPHRLRLVRRKKSS